MRCGILLWRNSDDQGEKLAPFDLRTLCPFYFPPARPQLREDFDQGVDVQLDQEHSVHDVAALLKEFLRDMPDPLLPRELYPAFLHANCERANTHT